VESKPGEEIVLDSSKSSDPDADSLTFNLYLYPEAGTYSNTIRIKDRNKSVVRAKILEDAGNKQIHIILEVTDMNSEVKLTFYRRIVIDVKE